jgi:hypothetical protein
LKSLENLNFIWENGSYSEMEISGCDKLPTLQGISSRDSGKVTLGSLGLEDENRYDRKEMTEDIMKTTLYASKVLDNQR